VTVPRLALRDYNDAVIAALRPPSRGYWLAVGALFLGIAFGAAAWAYQICAGMGVIGINHPIGWGTYIANFVFWIGIGHAGTLISAILYLFRVRWRNAIYRSAEAMTVFAVMTAGLFPLIHLGRVWVFWFILPYPNQRHLWPAFKSPLVWDVVAVTTYLIISVIFWYSGMIPDLAAVRDASTGRRHRIYRLLALGWTGENDQWRHYLRGYAALAALATPLVISVHSVVSWDFAASLLPGWHSTIFAPYFVVGAIHSGLAMVVLLLIPMRRLLHLERLVRVAHLKQAALLMILTGAIMLWAYAAEAFTSWYGADIFERQFTAWRMTGGYSPWFWLMVFCNGIAPMAFFWKRVRASLPGLLTISFLILLGMWWERWVIVITSTAHDFMPENWSAYHPTWVEVSVSLASLCWFLFWFLLFAKHLPVVSIAESKEPQVAEALEAVA
jgi:Ni/Fe-hydrogenase subunit HybB-like protein